jgi:hypothetical protein
MFDRYSGSIIFSVRSIPNLNKIRGVVSEIKFTDKKTRHSFIVSFHAVLTSSLVHSFSNSWYLLGWTRRLMTVFTRDGHWALLSVSSMKFTSKSLPTKFILALSSHLWLDLPSTLFHWYFSTKNSNVFLVSHVHTTCFAHVIHPS